jgi:hypothetical protein
MTRLVIAAALVAAFGVCLSVIPAKTASQARLSWEESQPQTVQSAGVHALVGASFHSGSIGY